eukprot:scpid43464/ scgid2879/ Serine/threonine-protein kinase pknB &gt; Serine/threonine-protein kinase pknB
MPLPSTRQLGPCGPFPMAFGVQTHSLQSPRDTQSIGLTSDTDSSSTAYRTGEEPRHDSRHEVVLPDSAHSQGSLTATALPEPQYAAGVRFERHDDDILGNGTFSTVFAGTYDGERVAVKCHKAGWRTRERYASGRSTDLRSRVAEEVQKLCSMNHGCIVRVMGVHSPPNEVPWIIMEALDMTLKERCRMQPPLQTREHLSIAYDLAMALSHMRNKKLLHRDLNPSNAMLIRKGGVHRCVVADLGSARSIDNNHEWWCLPLLSESGLYVAPEAQVSSDHCDVGSTAYGYPSDVYSVGVTILELISVTPITVTSKQQGYSVQLSEAASHPLHATLVKCLSTSPHDRPTAHALMRDIGEIHRGDFRELEDSVVAVSFPVSKMQNEYASSLAINRVAKGSIANGSPNKEFIHKIAMYHLRELLPTRWWKAGELREDVSLTSGNPCVHQGFVYRSAKVQGRQAGVLLRAPIDNLKEAAWRDFKLPVCPGGNIWSKRIYTFSLGSTLYSILTVHAPEKSQRPPPSIYRIDTDSAKPAWDHVIDLRSKRVHFCAQLIGDHLIVIGGRCYSNGTAEPGQDLRSAEFLTLHEDTVTSKWRALPDLPTACRLGRIVSYNGKICILGTNYHHRGQELTVFTLDLAALEKPVHQVGAVSSFENGAEIPGRQSFQPPISANRRSSTSTAAYYSGNAGPAAFNTSPVAGIVQTYSTHSAEPAISEAAEDEHSSPSWTIAWQSHEICPVPHGRCAAAVISSKLVIAGGRTQLGAMSGDCFVYNELTNEWVPFSTGLSSPREFAHLLVVRDSLVCLGGRSSRSHCDRDVEKLSLPHLNNSN